MLLAILLTLSTAQLASAPLALDLADPPAVLDTAVKLGQVPRLLPPPAGLPFAKTVAGGVLLPAPLDAYVGEQLLVLRRYPDLAQQALDASLADRGRRCDLQVQELKDTAAASGCPCWGAALRWGVGGAVVGALVGVLLTAYLLH
jgi:hypothetical protein